METIRIDLAPRRLLKPPPREPPSQEERARCMLETPLMIRTPTHEARNPHGGVERHPASLICKNDAWNPAAPAR